MTADPMVSIHFFCNINENYYVLINIAKNLSRRQTTKLSFQLVALNLY